MSGSEFKLFGDGLPQGRIVSRFGLREGLSAPFRAEVEFSTTDLGFDVSSVLGKSAALQITGVQAETRYVHGMIAETRFVRAIANRLHFCLVLRPTLWGLSLREDCRIFLNKSLPDVLQALLKESGMEATSHFQLQGTFAAREFVVQYRETTLNFFQRLCEDAGIFYYFTHSEEGHQLHLTDGLEALKDNPLVELTATPMAGQGKSPIQQLSRKKSLRVSEVTLRDFDFKNPTTFPQATAPLTAATPLLLFDYPGKFDKAPEGDRLAKTRLKSERWDADFIELTCSRADLSAGGRLNIEGVDEEELAGEFVVTEAVYSGLAHQAKEGRVAHYACHGQMQAVPLDSVYLPKRRAYRPKITGVQTAVVVGDDNSDQSIYVDKYGRIRVHFHWDRRGPFNETASCDVRVNQLPLGGSMILPRVGWEVLVAFEEGDPDRPLVMSRAYNAENMPPMALPAAKASGSISSKSSPGGAGSNEISMGDSGGGQGF
ncbi:MAG TPA: type VI secretion system tip protein TssI/VgrG, partial [Polyangiaceae bacterium]|nr:type VI secretion system tip protein TssI/VgrG [Polyangiaceae bacterium]